MIAIRPETKRDAAAREALLDEAFGAARFAKTAQRLREGRLPAEQLSFVACRDGKAEHFPEKWAPVFRRKCDKIKNPERLSDSIESESALVGTVRLWNISAGPGRPALLLGPLAVARQCRNAGVGAALIRHALAAASARGHGAVLLVGDTPYYGRFGFSADKTGALRLPGPYERHRLLACELKSGALDGARGLVSATGRPAPTPALAALVTGLAENDITSAARPARAS
jgi:predicted N-acetyltransferase YhbS